MAILIATAYIVTVSMVHNSPYVWLSLILVLMLCFTMFAYTKSPPIIRWSRSNVQSTTTNQNNEPEMTEVPAAIWMTDIPPSYSYVMETNAPVTPPPSYGSAILMFPWIAREQQSPDVSRLIENSRFRSVSRQVSETSGIYNGAFSRQTSRTDALSTDHCHGTLSRQTSRQDGFSTVRPLSAISRQISQVTIMSRQISMQECKQNQQPKTKLHEQGGDNDEWNENYSSVLINVEHITLQSESAPQVSNDSEMEENDQTINDKDKSIQQRF
ncbi:uncharacterized protein isoform X2 [Rhodnius prolixus]